jgi:hypothetical protein
MGWKPSRDEDLRAEHSKREQRRNTCGISSSAALRLFGAGRESSSQQASQPVRRSSSVRGLPSLRSQRSQSEAGARGASSRNVLYPVRLPAQRRGRQLQRERCFMDLSTGDKGRGTVNPLSENASLRNFSRNVRLSLANIAITVLRDSIGDT